MAVVAAATDLPNLEHEALEFVATQQPARTFVKKPRFSDILLDLKSCEAVEVPAFRNSCVQQCSGASVLPTVLSAHDDNLTNHVAGNTENTHVKAEQKRRKKIQTHLWRLVEFVPSMLHTRNAKTISELDVVNETVRCVKDLKSQKELLVQNIHELKKENTELMESISEFQANLPAKGINSSERRTVSLDDMYTRHVNQQACSDWKYWIFSVFSKPLFETFKPEVVTSTAEEFVSSLNQWTEERLCLTFLRPVVIHGLRDIALMTSVVDHPYKLKDEVMNNIKKVKTEKS